MRGDGFKLLRTYQRPISRRTSGIGIWQDVLQALSVVAMLTNCALIAFATNELDRWFPGITREHKILGVFAIEHLVLVLRYAVQLSFPQSDRDLAHASLRSARATNSMHMNANSNDSKQI